MVRLIAAVLLGVFVIAGPYLYARHRHGTYRNFHVVTEGVLYRSGQNDLTGLKRILGDHEIKTVISLRYPRFGKPLPPDIDEQRYCEANGIRYVRIKPKDLDVDENNWQPTDDTLEAFFKELDDPKNHPVLVHCMAGMHRTGAVCGVYRMEYDGWNSEEAMREMRQCGYVTLDDQPEVMQFMRNYRRRSVRNP